MKLRIEVDLSQKAEVKREGRTENVVTLPDSKGDQHGNDNINRVVKSNCNDGDEPGGREGIEEIEGDGGPIPREVAVPNEGTHHELRRLERWEDPFDIIIEKSKNLKNNIRGLH